MTCKKKRNLLFHDSRGPSVLPLPSLPPKSHHRGKRELQRATILIFFIPYAAAQIGDHLPPSPDHPLTPILTEAISRNFHVTLEDRENVPAKGREAQA